MAKSKATNTQTANLANIATEVTGEPTIGQAVASLTGADEVEYVTLTLPKGSKVTASKRTIIAPPHALTAGKERWFEVKRLKSYSVADGMVSITIAKSALGYRQMLPDEA